MKATDLIIGDWVMIKDYPMKAMPKQMSPEYYTRSLVEIEPIPLTEEILEKNGIKLFYTYTHPYRDGEWEEVELEEAKKHYPMYVYKTLNPYITFVIRPNEQELKVCSSNYKTKVEKKEEVIFVHELQHALRLCGIEKEIVL